MSTVENRELNIARYKGEESSFITGVEFLPARSQNWGKDSNIRSYHHVVQVTVRNQMDTAFYFKELTGLLSKNQMHAYIDHNMPQTILRVAFSDLQIAQNFMKVLLNYIESKEPIESEYKEFLKKAGLSSAEVDALKKEPLGVEARKV